MGPSSVSGFTSRPIAASGRVLELISEDCLPNANKMYFEVEQDLETTVSRALDAVEKFDRDGSYLDRIRALRSALQRAKQREPERQLEIPTVGTPGH